MNEKEEICKFCYESRHSAEYHDLQSHSRAGAPCFKRFDTIRHIIGRLHHTMKAIKALIMVALKLPHLFDNVQIFRERSCCSTSPPLQERNPSLSEIAGRMRSDPKQIAEMRSALQAMDQKHGLSDALRKQCLKRSWRPKVHTELLLLNLFWTKKFDFVDGDRYIACSKSACYCCYHYIRNHPGRFVESACHNNHWINWQPPDIHDAGHFKHCKTREDILNKMAQSTRNEAIGRIMERRGPAKWKADSNTVISSVKSGGFTLSRAGATGKPDGVDGYSSDEDFNEGSESDSNANSNYNEVEYEVDEVNETKISVDENEHEGAEEFKEQESTAGEESMNTSDAEGGVPLHPARTI